MLLLLVQSWVVFEFCYCQFCKLWDKRIENWLRQRRLQYWSDVCSFPSNIVKICLRAKQNFNSKHNTSEADFSSYWGYDQHRALIQFILLAPFQAKWSNYEQSLHILRIQETSSNVDPSASHSSIPSSILSHPFRIPLWVLNRVQHWLLIQTHLLVLFLVSIWAAHLFKSFIKLSFDFWSKSLVPIPIPICVPHLDLIHDPSCALSGGPSSVPSTISITEPRLLPSAAPNSRYPSGTSIYIPSSELSSIPSSIPGSNCQLLLFLEEKRKTIVWNRNYECDTCITAQQVTAVRFYLICSNWKTNSVSLFNKIKNDKINSW